MRDKPSQAKLDVVEVGADEEEDQELESVVEVSGDAKGDQESSGSGEEEDLGFIPDEQEEQAEVEDQSADDVISKSNCSLRCQEANLASSLSQRSASQHKSKASMASSQKSCHSEASSSSSMASLLKGGKLVFFKADSGAPGAPTASKTNIIKSMVVPDKKAIKRKESQQKQSKRAQMSNLQKTLPTFMRQMPLVEVQ